MLTVFTDHLLETKKKYNPPPKKKQAFQDIFTKNELGKACFPHDMAYGDFKDLPRTSSDKLLQKKD